MIDHRFGLLRRTLLIALLWSGLVLCVLAISQYWNESSRLMQGLSVGNSLLLIGALILIWVLAVASWQSVMRAYGSGPIPSSVAARHLALLLLGKYLPGGIWGFAARLTDSASQRSLSSMFAAGIAEQWLGLISMSTLAALGMWAARIQRPEVLLVILAAPILAVTTLSVVHVLLHRARSILPSRLQQFHDLSASIVWSRPLWIAAVLTSLQQILVLGVVVGLAEPSYMLTPAAALAVASSYGLAVVAGIVVVFMPGGILVREGVFVALSTRWLHPAQAIALAAGLRLLFTAFDLLAGILAGSLHMKKTRRE